MSHVIIDITPNNEPKPSLVKRLINLIGRYIGLTIAIIIMIGLAGWVLFALLAWLWPLILLVAGIILFLGCFMVVGNFFEKKELLDLSTSEENTSEKNTTQEN